MRGRYLALASLLVVVAFAAGIALERFQLGSTGEDAGGQKVLYWVAPMDPNFRRDEPGKSPMGMDLVPVYEGEEAGGDPAAVELSGAEVNAIGVRTAVARVEEVARSIETVGFVRYNEHLTSHIHTRVEGWIERLGVRAIGDRVAKGDTLFTMYAPDVTIGSSELVRAVRRGNALEIEITRKKLRNLGVPESEIDRMAASDVPIHEFHVFAPRDGVVTALEAADGMFLKPDVRAMTISDLSEVWLLVDVFERDIGRLSSRKTATAQFEHLPGKVFEGTIDYIYPELDRTTRTLPIRLSFDNAEGDLRPNMYGQVKLEPEGTREALTVPMESVIRTGRAERVVIKQPDGSFKPRLVTTGLNDSFGGGGRTEIVQGLAAGEEVVASAQFLIDSESALNAGILRMAPTKSEPAAGKGTLVHLDKDRRIAEIAHEALPSLDWPAMTTRFALASDVAYDRLEDGQEVKFSAVRGADNLLALHDLRPDDGVDAVGTGIVKAITDDGKINLSHDPIPALGWPAMQMDMPVRDVELGSVPLDEPIRFDLVKGEGGTFIVTAIRAAGDEPEMAEDAQDKETAMPADMRLMVTEGTINAVDAAKRSANVTHGPLTDIGMPGMTMDFPLAEGLKADTLKEGAATVTIGLRADGRMVLADAKAAKPPMKTIGTINSVNMESRTANITHGPLADIGMPGMTMDFPVAEGIDVETLPRDVEIELHLQQNPDFSLMLTGYAEGRS
ncbi:efflux RND transporter periplasmic adaptor subunit [Tepidamorphus sp. 3E244]|uniref:efflux RND transporter periplasmic adaptor subunit n=1 Tax=Tepidamorphus sp. 3E244 TaxID=3385498 RepID=UPI0038FC499D